MMNACTVLYAAFRETLTRLSPFLKVLLLYDIHFYNLDTFGAVFIFIFHIDELPSIATLSLCTSIKVLTVPI